MLVVENVSFSYKRKAQVLRDASFTLSQGDCLCLLGPNGTGKSTLLKCILNLEKASGGNISVDGNDITRLSAGQRAKLIAYVAQSSNMTFPYKVKEMVLMGRVTHFRFGSSASDTDVQIAEEALEKLGVGYLADEYFQELSGGQKQMVLVARALAQQSRYIVMDEPTANLDYSNQVKVLMAAKKLADEGYAVLMTSHFPDHAFLACNRAALMRDGVVMNCGQPEEVVTSENLTRLYEIPVCVTGAEIQLGEHYSNAKVCIPVMHTL